MDKTTHTIAINSVTEPGFLFGLGNAAATSQDPVAMGLNIGMGITCFGIRLTSEMRNAGYNIPLTAAADTFLKNPGAAIMMNGAVAVMAAGAMLRNIDFSKSETVIPPAIMACFGANGICLGIAKQLDPESKKRKYLEAAGSVAVSTGLLISAPGAPLEVKTLFATSGIMGICMAAFNKKAQGVLQPYLTNAAGATLAAVNSPSAAFRFANATWAAGYIALNALMKHGGVVQAIQKAKTRLWGALQPNIEP